MEGSLRTGRSPLAFLILLIALALPVWLFGAGLGVIPSLRIPVSDLALAFVPMAAALILVTWKEGGRAAVDLLRRAVDPTSTPARWLLVALLLAPAIYLATWLIMRAAGGPPSPPLAPARLALLSGLFFVLAVGEEVGWMGYAFDPLQRRWGALAASLILAAPWWAGHLPSMLAIGATPMHVATWVLGAAALRVLFSWLYNNAGGSLFTAVLFHTLLNAGRIAVYPAEGSHYDGTYQAVGYAVTAVLAIAVMLRSKLGTLTR